MTWKETTNILAIRLDHMGDLLMTTPALRAIKADKPERKITLLGSPQNGAISQFVPEVDASIMFENTWMSSEPEESNFKEIVKEVKNRQFDGAIVFQPHNHNPLPAAMIAYLAGIPRRLALCRENPFHLLTNWYPDPEPYKVMKHEVIRQLDLVGSAGFKTEDTSLSLKADEAAYEQVRKKLKERDIDSKHFVVFHPGASEKLRRYPSAAFIAAGKSLAKDFPILITGTGNEEELVQEIRKGIGDNAYSLADKLTLKEFIALIDISSVLVSNNTGPAHIAAAMKTPVVDLFSHPNSPLHYPWQTPHRLLFFDSKCKSCERGICILDHSQEKEDIQPHEIIGAVYDLLQKDYE